MSEKSSKAPLRRLAGVSWPGLMLYTGLWIGLGAASGALGAYWLITRFDLRVPVAQQAITVDLPPSLNVEVELQQMQPVDSQSANSEKVVLLPVHLRDEFQVEITLDNKLPLKMVVPYKGRLPVNTIMPIDTVVQTKVLGIPMTVPVKGNIPINTVVDVDLRIPIDQTVPVAFSAPVKARLDHIVQIPIPAKQQARISMGSARMPITLQETEFVMPLSGVALTRPKKKESDMEVQD